MASRAPRRPPPAAARRSPVSVPSAATRDADGTRADILAIATEEFAKKGLSGSRVDEIAERTHTVKQIGRASCREGAWMSEHADGMRVDMIRTYRSVIV